MITRRSLMLTSLATFGALALPLSAKDGDFHLKDGLAVSGYDPVTYFTEGAAVEGDAAYQTMWHGVTWQFSSAENMEAFEMNPEAYAPQYGGHCAYAAAKGALAPADPNAWTIRNGKLYLNFSLKVRERWLEDPDKYIEMADANWPNL